MPNDDPASIESSEQRSWFERLSQLLLREPQDREQLIMLLRDCENRELLDTDALRMIEGVLAVSEMQVRDIMIPRAQMVVVEHDMTPDEFVPLIIKSTHSRIPVTGENLDEVIGILHAKDLLKYYVDEEHRASFELNSILRPAVFTPESKRLDVLLQEFRKTHTHMAIVVNEFGGVDGLVTIEDILEEIVGEIEDEHDIWESEEFIKQRTDGGYTVNPLTPIENFNGFFDCQLSDEEFDTIGGLVTHHLGHLPKRGERVSFDQFTFKILAADRRRIRLLQVEVTP